ncbi:hypothetical protein ACWEV3_10930 [Saccharopolyspora sp. NPDC003752]
MSENTRLAVVLRTAQWELDEVAFALPRGEVTHEQRAHLAETLAALARLLATPLPGEPTSASVVAVEATRTA